MTIGSSAAWAHSGAGGQQAITTDVVRDVSTSTSQTLSGRLDQLNGNGGGGSQAMVTPFTGESGKSGASSLKDTALWVNFGYTSLENTNVNTAYDGHVLGFLVGVDTRPIDPLTIGVAFGYENLDLDTTFNQGTLTWNGYTVSPYAVYRFLRNYSIDGSIGYTWLSADNSRLNNTVQGSYDSDRWTGALNVNGFWAMNKWRFGASVGYLYLRQDDDPYNEVGPGAGSVAGQQTRLGQSRVGGRVGYDFGMIEPYARVRWEHDFVTGNTMQVAPGVTTSPSRNGVVIGGGALFNINSRLTGGVEATTTQGREDLDIWTVMGTLRFRF